MATTEHFYTGNGSTTTYAYTFPYYKTSDIKVTWDDVLKTESTHYNVTGTNIVFTSGNIPANGETVVLRRVTPQTQGMDLIENDPLPAETLENAFDKVTSIVQELQEQLDRSIKVSKTATITTPEITDDASARAGKLLGFDSTGNVLDATIDGSGVAVSATNAAHSATAAANSATAAATSATNAENAKNAAEAALDTFDDAFLGAKTSNPTLDNDGNALQDGALIYHTNDDVMKVYDLGNTQWRQLTPTSSQQTNIDAAVANASNINAGTLSSSRLPATISADTNGNAATATQLSSAVTIAGVSFDGSQNIDLPGVNTTGNQDTTGNASTATALASSVNINGNAFDGTQSIDISYNDLTNLPTIPTNNNQLTNGAGYSTFDGDYNSLSNLPTIPTNNNQLSNGAGYSTFSGSYNDLSNKPTIPTNNNQLTNGAGYITSASAGIPASGGTFTGDIGVSGGAGALTVNGNSDIRFTNGNWTGDTYGKIQHHGNSMYLLGGSQAEYMFIFRYNNSDKVYMRNNGTIWPAANNSADLGKSDRRWANIYLQDMHFSNGEDNPNKVDGTWGDWTLQEGVDQIYMLNNRNGKKYKMNLTEIV